MCVSPSSTLREVMALLAEHRLHRLHVTDEHQRPVGIVTITDLLRVIVGCNELLEALGPVSTCTAGLGRRVYTGAAGSSARDLVLICWRHAPPGKPEQPSILTMHPAH